MEVRAVSKYVRVQPRKVRIIADEVRGKTAQYTVALLRYHPSKSAKALRKALISAMANAEENHGISPETLRVQTIMIDEGPRLKRMQPKAMGRGGRIVKKTSHITVVVEEFEPAPKMKPHGTKAKARPTLAGGKKSKKKAEAVKPVEAAPVAEPEVVEEAPVVEAVAEPEAEVAVEAEAPVEAAEETTSPEPDAPADDEQKGAE